MNLKQWYSMLRKIKKGEQKDKRKYLAFFKFRLTDGNDGNASVLIDTVGEISYDKLCYMVIDGIKLKEPSVIEWVLMTDMVRLDRRNNER